jgi:hypothetical protein
LIVGLAGGGWLYRDVLANYLPTDQVAGLQQRVDLLGKSSEEASTQLQAVARLADQLKSDIDALESDSGTFKDQIKSVSGDLASSKSDVAQVHDDVAQLKQTVAALQAVAAQPQTSGAGAAPSVISPDVLARLAALEQDVSALKAQKGSAPDKAVLTQVMANLKASIGSGNAYAEDYDRLSRLVPAAAGLDMLALHAADGLPNAKGLATELAALKPGLPVPSADAAPVADPGWWDSMVSALSSIITIRDVGATNWQQVAERAIAYLDSDDIAQAVAAIDEAEGERPQALQAWRDRAAARIALDAALAAAADSVGRSLAAGP